MREHRGFLFALRFALNRILVRSSGFEPPRYCYRQPLKLVRLPVPPRPLTEMYLTSSEVRFLCETPIIGPFHSNVNICAASVCLHRFSSTGARPSSFWTLGKLLCSRLHSGANGGKLGSRCAKACDEIENLFEEDGAIEAP